MKKFLYNICYVVIITILLFSLLLLLPVTKKMRNELYYAIIDKDSLLINTDGKRIIFIGGSNLSFGLNCQIFKDSLGLNPINTGIHLNIGLIYMLDNTIRNIRKGDIVVICPEYHQFFDNNAYGVNGSELLKTTCVYGLCNLNKLRPFQLKGIIKFIPMYELSKLKFYENYYTPSKNEMFSRTSFNKYGDAVAHWQKEAIPVSPALNFGSFFNYDVIQELKLFNEEILKKGATCYISYSCLQERSFNNCRSQIDFIESEINKTKIPVLGNPRRYAFSDVYLYNTIYHLNKKGVDIRTLRLLNDIRIGIRTH